MYNLKEMKGNPFSAEGAFVNQHGTDAIENIPHLIVQLRDILKTLINIGPIIIIEKYPKKHRHNMARKHDQTRIQNNPILLFLTVFASPHQ